MLTSGLGPPQPKASGTIGTLFADGRQIGPSIANQTPCSPRGKDGAELSAIPLELLSLNIPAILRRSLVLPAARLGEHASNSVSLMKSNSMSWT